jgi:Domain of unknown function (DUF6471)
MSVNPIEEEWAERAKRFLKAKLKQTDVSYEELAKRLTDMGLPETKASIASKLARGRYSALFLFGSCPITFAGFTRDIYHPLIA